jgi:hypothetical protein
MRTTFRLALLSLLSLCLAPAETIYFQLGPYPLAEEGKERVGSAVIPLTRPEHIAHARDLILRGPTVNGEPNQPIVGARVRAGKDGINRNYSDPRLPEWSWHVYEVYGFADAIGGPSGASPKLLEEMISQNPDAWNERRPVSFTSVTVVRELGPHPLFVSAFWDTGKLQFYWTPLGTNFASCTLETTDSLGHPDWRPVPGQWPAQTNHCSLRAPAGANQFFRVRAHPKHSN